MVAIDSHSGIVLNGAAGNGRTAVVVHINTRTAALFDSAVSDRDIAAAVIDENTSIIRAAITDVTIIEHTAGICADEIDVIPISRRGYCLVRGECDMISRAPVRFQNSVNQHRMRTIEFYIAACFYG